MIWPVLRQVRFNKPCFRKSKNKRRCVVGLVENMVSGVAQRMETLLNLIAEKL